ncbi:peptidase M4 [Chromobacterium sp. ATCC 53434]|uniref:PepSY domain-containing protein n=1 Tax=Chromobacterium sp. (strain ATCC 53434 / SC 14030) TaxID=2059672 RepID=UPI000C7850BB|nr:PepSY domain-containing protein [Chromobacterium sp. ATCC 53434]AUH49987.1 peptidase M4 [Chromobacterium sp. ATCC 53434]
MYRYSKLSLLAIIVFTCGAAAYAARSGARNDALAVSQVRIPLTQAIAIAERHVNGRAVRAESERADLGWAYAVEVARGGKTFDVSVDPDKGVVLAPREERMDRDERD